MLTDKPKSYGRDSKKRKTLVLGLGNDILSDDAVGLLAVRALKDACKARGDIDFVETNEMGLSLLDFLEGYDHAVIIDSIVTEKYRPGTLHVFDRKAFDNPLAGNPHHMGLDEVLALAGKMKIPVPEDLSVLAVEVKDPFTFGERLTPEMEKAMPRTVSKIAKLVDGFIAKGKG